MSRRTHVPDKLEAFLLQVRHALFELISADENSVVSVEAYEDVAIENNNHVVAEQVKSVLSNNNPVANKSTVFWKTLYNWCEYISLHKEKNWNFKFVIVSSNSLKAGNIPETFANAKSKEDAKKALDLAKGIIQMDNDHSEDTETDKNKVYLNYCFSEQNEETMLKVIELMSIDIHATSYDNELKNKFNNQPIPNEYNTELFFSMLGWLNEKVHEQIKENKPAYITRKEYRDILISEIRGRDLNKILSSVSVKPNHTDTNQEVERHDTYIKQLELIDASTTEIYAAASDYLRTCVEKTEWSKKGIITDRSFEDYYDGLKRTWDSRKRIIELRNISDEKKQGMTLYAECTEAAMNFPLQANAVPNFFGAGCLHSMSNETIIGWHPRYNELLKEKEDIDE